MNKNTRKPWKIIIFDLDGTLMNTEEGVLASVSHAIAQMGFEPLPYEQLRTFIGPPVLHSFTRIFHLSEEDAQKATSIFRDRYSTKDLLLAKPYDGIMDLLKQLKAQGYLIGVATLKREDYAVKLLEHYHIADYCDTIAGSDMASKFLKADVLNQCFTRLNIKPEEAVLIGDTASDGNGARLAGCDFIGVTFGFGPATKEAWEEFAPVAVAESGEELIEYFK